MQVGRGDMACMGKAGCDEAGLLQAWPAVVGLKTLGLGPMKITLVNKNK